LIFATFSTCRRRKKYNSTTEEEKKKKEEEEELFFCLLRLINSTELIRCQCCSDFGRFVRLISGEKTQRNSKKAKEINGNR
jgi:hypothetical protein